MDDASGLNRPVDMKHLRDDPLARELIELMMAYDQSTAIAALISQIKTSFMNLSQLPGARPL